jgi:DNA uptake protein ComE-like DNA-binding protein
VFHALLIRDDARALLGQARAAQDARRRLERRRDGVKLARRDPELARELGIGSVRDEHGYGLLDVNEATASELAALPAVNPDLAERIVHYRMQLGGFASLTELGHELDLSPATIAALEDRVVFLPSPRR